MSILPCWKITIPCQLTAYSGEIEDTPRYPLETLLAGGGDCEDHAILFASMILAADIPNWKVSLVYMDSYNPARPQAINHMIVYIETDNRSYTIEATGKEIMEPYPEGVGGWYSEVEN
jgi:transglutaminase-like putative cysteine protease